MQVKVLFPRLFLVKVNRQTRFCSSRIFNHTKHKQNDAAACGNANRYPPIRTTACSVDTSPWLTGLGIDDNSRRNDHVGERYMVIGLLAVVKVFITAGALKWGL